MSSEEVAEWLDEEAPWRGITSRKSRTHIDINLVSGWGWIGEGRAGALVQTLTHTHTHTGKPGAAVGDRVVTRGRSGGQPEMLSISLPHNTPMLPE